MVISTATALDTLAPRERILEVAYTLFSTRGVRDVGIDEIIQDASVAKATFYRHFPSKDELVLAFLDERRERWTLDFVEARARGRGATPEARLLAIFDIFDEWFNTPEFEGCSFINVVLEMRPSHAAGRAGIEHLAEIRDIVTRLADEAELDDPTDFAHDWHILMKGSIIAAAEGDTDAALRAKRMGAALIERHRDPGGG